jgi:hypothetical protein
MNENEIGRAFSTYGGGEGGWGNLRKKDHLAYLIIDGRIILK